MFGPDDLSYLSIKELGMIEEYQESFDKDFVKIFKKFDKFDDVKHIDNLIDILKSLRHNEHYIELIRIHKNDNLTEDFIDSEKNPFFHAAKKGFGISIPIILVPGFGVLNLFSFVGVESIIELSYVYSSGHKITPEITKKIVYGDILPHLTYFVEDYDKHNELPKPSIEFFKKLKKVKIEKRAEKLSDTIYRKFMVSLNSEIHLLHGVLVSGEFNRTYYNSAFYLAGCNAIKDGRDTISCEDMVIGYLLTFKVLLSDVRSLVDEYYCEDRWLEYENR